MNGEIKFRVWDNVGYMSSPFTLTDIQFKKIGFGSGCPVMQYTGLKDKNGVEIYDGDVLLHFGRFKRICEYQDGAFGYKADLDFGFISYNSNAYNLGLAESVITKAEVIGNIYQNPELLK